MFGNDPKSSAMSVEQALNQAVRHHQAGKFAEAEKIYWQILQMQPNHPDALHLLGMIAFQSGQSQRAAELIRRAIAMNPSIAIYQNNLGMALRECGRIDEAAAAYRRAIELQPDYAEPQNNLGNILKDQRDYAGAIAAFENAVRLQPDFAEAHYNLGCIFKEQGRLEEAAKAFRRAITIKPNLIEAHNNLGLTFTQMKLFDEALAAFGALLKLKPDYAEAYNGIGAALEEQGREPEAMQAYQNAVKLNPDNAEAHNNIGNLLRKRHEFAEAITEYRLTLKLKPDLAEAHNNLGNALRDQGKTDEAMEAYRRAVELKPDFIAAQNNLGFIFKDQGRLDECIATYRTALKFDPRDHAVHSSLVYTLYFHPAYEMEAIYREHVKWNQFYAEPLRKFILQHFNDRNPERRLRIGYVSPNFSKHCQSFFTVPLLSNHNHEEFKIYCYSNVIGPDALTQRLRGYADVWRSVVGLTREQTADLIRQDQIDILVDLAMHMANSTPLLFALKPAPIQVAWLAYPGTTGLTTMDYRLTDPRLDPPGLYDAFYSEESIRLPDTFWCYDPLTSEPAINELPALKNGNITFGCLNNFCKLSTGVLKLWARVLTELPNSRLILLAPAGTVREVVRAEFTKNNVKPERVEFTEFLPNAEYLKLYNRIDMVLDTFPYNGHTTSLDSFWMGVPVVTLIGNTVVGRAGLSQLHNLDLKELAAQTPEEYVDIATKLAGDLARLAELRRTLRERMKNSPLMDAKCFAHNIETAYRKMWRKWCDMRE